MVEVEKNGGTLGDKRGVVLVKVSHVWLTRFEFFGE